MPRTKATLIDVAGAAGVSLATVDRVINQRGSVRPETEQRVFDAARRLKLDRSLSHSPVRLLRFSIVMLNSKAGFYQKLRQSIRLAQAVFRNLNVVVNTYLFDLGSEEGPAKAIETASMNCHGLIYVGPDHPEAVSALSSVPAECPILTFASDIPASRRIAYFGPDNFTTGRLAGDLLGRFANGTSGFVLLLIGMHRYAGHRQREMGFRSVLAERFANLSVIQTYETLEEPRRASEFVESKIGDGNNILGIYNTSNGNRAISDLLVTKNRTKIVFINHELTDKTRAHLMNGVVDVIIDHNTDNDFQNAIEYLLYYNHRIVVDDMLKRDNLNVYFRETAIQAMPVV